MISLPELYTVSLLCTMTKKENRFCYDTLTKNHALHVKFWGFCLIDSPDRPAGNLFSLHVLLLTNKLCLEVSHSHDGNPWMAASAFTVNMRFRTKGRQVPSPKRILSTS